MPWCPICKNEYYEGIKVCADCKVELVDSLDETTDLYLNPEADELFQNFQEALENHSIEKLAEEQECVPIKGTYKSYEERAEENKSSAITLIFVGGIGFIVLLLIYFDILSVPISLKSNYMLTGVMLFMFLLFLVMGVVSAKNAHKYHQKAHGENALTDDIKKWCKENIDICAMDKALFLEDDVSEEQKYFRRFEEVKRILNEQFHDLDDAYLNRLVDESYQDIFEES